MTDKKTTWILAGMVGVFIFGMLVGRAFGYQWAGGEGVQEQFIVQAETVEGDVTVERNGEVRQLKKGGFIRRGGIVKTSNGARALLSIKSEFTSNGAWIGLQQRTDIRLDRLSLSNLHVNIDRGRIAVSHWGNTPTVTTDYLRIIPKAKIFTVVNFDFLETVYIGTFDEPISAIHRNGSEWVIKEAARIHETQPVSFTEAMFDSNKIMETEFYSWFNEQIKLR